MSFRAWVTTITLIMLVAIVFFAWEEIIGAWNLLGQTNLWILSLLIPVQLFSYYATGGIIFSYLRRKGEVKDLSRWSMARMALELNFVNHVIPSGGAAGFSYLGWILHRHGVKPGRATMAQIVRFALTFFAYLILLVIAIIVLTADHTINPLTAALSSVLAFMIIGGSLFMIYVIGNKKRLMSFSVKLTNFTNRTVRFFTRDKQREVLKLDVIESFFEDLHQDYLELRREKKILGRPFVWSLFATAADIFLIFIAFWALGIAVNPAVLFIAYGLSSVAAVLSLAPGGAGAYEAIMIAFLASAGVPADAAIAGTLLARVTLLLGTIAFGYVFYQLTLNKYGRRQTKI